MLPFAQLQRTIPPLSHLKNIYEKMASNPAFTERNLQNAIPYLLSGAKVFGHVSHSTELVHRGPTGKRPLRLTKGEWNASEPKLKKLLVLS